jgi:transcriptional regulator with XRE-family HTH domain
MAEDMGSTVPRRQLGRMLRQLRTEAGITLDAAADSLGCSRQKVWRVEIGLGPARSPDVKAMCELYDVTPDLVTALTGLATETKAKGWWHAYGDAIPEWFELFVGLEAAAFRLRRYDGSLIPGLLQTRSYAMGIYRLDRPHASQEEHERAVEVRMQRQSLLVRRLPAPPRLQVVLSEAALLRVVVDKPTMANQLRKLLAAAKLPHVSIRVLPLAAGPHRGAMAETFVMLEFPVGSRNTPEPPVIYSESWTGALYLDRPDEVAAYEDIWTSLGQLALDEGQSKHMINKIIEEIYRG